eukprot:TRINITY_DN50359_c0_g1_i1.p1 TRINITY_DN50359_c0_g1~~TRINITY_DN50359_c0_g1_i1.p1  ORF type:complete len:621 (+),score=135.33 TRINITY_DN50359_c0_g1_i1:131-1993(+)
MSEALFSDPNCTRSERWSAFREALRRGRVSLSPGVADGPLTGVDAAAEAQRLELGVAEALHEGDQCFLGAATLLLSQVVASWRGGRFIMALQMFSMLHDQFLANAHPGFFESNVWPVRDPDVREWKDRFLFQIRRFRQLAGNRLEQGMAAFSEESMPDAVERENLGSLAAHVIRQIDQQGRRLEEETKDGLTDEALDEHRYVPSWEVLAVNALVPSFRSDARPPLKIYVYDEAIPGIGKLTHAPAFCHYRQWGMDVGFHDFFRQTPARTFNADEADYFFVPSYACCHQVAGLREFDVLDATHAAVVKQLPYFARSNGRDHIFSFHYVDLFPGWRSHIPHSVFLTPETEVGFERSLDDFDVDQLNFPPFSPAKDLSVPPYLNMKDILGFHSHSRPMAEREHVAVFAGKLWKDLTEAADIRGRVAALKGLPGVHIHAFPTIAEMLGPDGMQSLMGNARFCLCPRGRAAWSVRFFESLWAGCVPVILSDHYEPPFDTLFDVTEFVIKWPMDRIDESLIQFLTNIPLDVVERYQAAAKRVRCWYLYPPPEVSWLGNWQARHELEQVEEHVCPNLSSSRNAFQAVLEVLARRKRRSKPTGGRVFYVPDVGGGTRPTFMDNELKAI